MSYVLWKVVFTQTASARRPPKLLTCITSLSPFSTKFDRLRELISLEAGSQNLQLSLMTITVHCNTCGRWFILLSNWGRCAVLATFWRQWRLSQKLGARFPMGNCHSYLYMCVLTQRGRCSIWAYIITESGIGWSQGRVTSKLRTLPCFRETHAT